MNPNHLNLDADLNIGVSEDMTHVVLDLGEIKLHLLPELARETSRLICKAVTTIEHHQVVQP